MSPITQALRAKFESVARAELQRMKKKTASMSEEERAQLEAISVHVAQALAAQFEQGRGLEDFRPAIVHLAGPHPDGAARKHHGGRG
jgi:hypothetical protein